MNTKISGTSHDDSATQPRYLPEKIEVDQPVEVNFDGLVGPTHNYSGLPWGNIASLSNAFKPSHPKQAALQGLQKMWLLKKLGLIQGILPPHERPHLATLRQLGFYGSDIEILQHAKKTVPEIFYACYSSSSMWAANAATVSPSRDCSDGEERRLHITPANLMSYFHRSLEAEFTTNILRHIFRDKEKFKVHSPLPRHPIFSDEGAANHNRICLDYGGEGVEVFVYGRSCFIQSEEIPHLYPARQTLEASSAIARRHRLSVNKVFFVKQQPYSIDQGVFHNDVISVMNQNVILFHEKAFVDEDLFVKNLKGEATFPLYFLKVTENELSVKEAVESYLFNSQLITLPDENTKNTENTKNKASMSLIAPIESQEMPRARAAIDRIIHADNPIRSVHFVDCRESMKNGGGPACLRLRVVMTPDEVNAIDPFALLTENRYQQLTQWVVRYYRDILRPDDLLDPLLLEETQTALDELTKILELGSVYSFQK